MPTLTLEDIKIQRQTDRNIAVRLPNQHPAYDSNNPVILDRCETLIRRSIYVVLDIVVENAKVPNGQISCQIISGSIVIDGNADTRIRVDNRGEIIDQLKTDIKQYVRAALQDY